jgi:hypothetical protein
MKQNNLPLTVGILIFDQVEVLDVTGPFEVFSVTRLNEERPLTAALLISYGAPHQQPKYAKTFYSLWMSRYSPLQAFLLESTWLYVL